MKTLNIKKELENWLVDYLTNTVHSLKSENCEDFNNWAKSFEKEEAAFLVGMEFVSDFGYDERTEITESEAEEYAQGLLRIIIDNWNK